MSRRHLSFACEGETLVGTLDEAAGETGLLIVSGGNETRAGAFSGQAELAARIAGAGFPVFRFDRRGIGDSSGENRGFRESGPDIAAALAAFREHAPGMKRVVGFGICDAASALMLISGAGFGGLALANPWTLEGDDNAVPPKVLRSRYLSMLARPGQWARLFTGKVSYAKLAGGLRQAAGPAPQPTALAREMATGLAGFEGKVAILLAGRDRAAQAFEAVWDEGDARVSHCPGATHAFAEAESRDWLFDRLLETLQSA